MAGGPGRTLQDATAVRAKGFNQISRQVKRVGWGFANSKEPIRCIMSQMAGPTATGRWRTKVALLKSESRVTFLVEIGERPGGEGRHEG